MQAQKSECREWMAKASKIMGLLEPLLRVPTLENTSWGLKGLFGDVGVAYVFEETQLISCIYFPTCPAYNSCACGSWKVFFDGEIRLECD